MELFVLEIFYFIGVDATSELVLVLKNRYALLLGIVDDISGLF